MRENLIPLTVFLAAAAVFAFVRFTTHPSLNRPWAPNQALLATVTVDGDTVWIRNMRASGYRSAGEATPTYIERSFKLTDLRKACLIKEVQGSLGQAHLMLEFEFGNNDWVVFSPEPRLERGEGFSALKGFFRRYELAYMVETEMDAIGYRTNVLNHPVYLFDLRLTGRNLRNLFEDVARRESKLAQDPEFYHTLFNSVESNIIRHLKKVANSPVSGPLLFPSNGDRMAFNMKLLRPETPLLTLRDRGMITRLARACPSETQFSQTIHGPLDGMFEE